MASLGRIALAALGIIAYKNRDKLSEWLSGARQPVDPNNPQAGRNPFDQIFGGANGPLGDLLERIRRAGRGDAVDSWVKKGPNEPITPANVEQAIDEETLASIAQQTGLSRDEILQRLAANLPEAVDDISPDGHLPEDQSDHGEPTLLDPVSPVPKMSGAAEPGDDKAGTRNAGKTPRPTDEPGA